VYAALSVSTSDKRESNTNTIVPPAPPKRGLAYKRTNTEWNTDDDSEITEPRNEPNDLRDSGISTASLLDFQSHLNNLGYEDFEPRSRCNDIMNISPPSVISAFNVSTGSFPSGTFQGSHSLPSQEVRKLN
jgi:dedicator of cytokinesis protein 3